MGIEIIQYQSNAFCLGIKAIELLEESGESPIASFATYMSQALSRQGFDGCQDTSRTVFGVSIVLFGRFTPCMAKPSTTCPIKKQGRSSKHTTG